MGNAIYRITETGLKRVRNIRCKGELSFDRTRNVKMKTDDVICTYFDGINDWGRFPETNLLSWSENGSIEAEVMIPDGCIGGLIASQGSDDIDYPELMDYNHGLSIGATNTFIYANFAVITGNGYPLIYNIDTTSLGWFKIRGEYIKGTGGRLYLNDVVVATVSVPNYPLRYGLYSFFARIPGLGVWMHPNVYANLYVRNIKYYNGSGELVLHYPMDDELATEIFREIINGIHAERIGDSSSLYSSALQRLNV